MLTVSQAIPACNTGQIQGLSLQVLDKILELHPDKLSRIKHNLIVCEGSQNNPYLQTQAYKALVKAVEERGIPLHINSCLRTPMQQHMLRRQFEMNLCGIMAAAPPPLSNHNSGLAIDIQDSVGWRTVLQKHNWKWIGSFDPMHYDFVGGGENLGSLQVKVFQQLWNQFNPDDKIKDDGLWGINTAARVDKSPAEGFGNPPVLKQGMMSNEVGELQLLLRKALKLTPEELKADMHFGADTFKAVSKFQEENGLEADGVAGSQTIAKLEEVTGETFDIT